MLTISSGLAQARLQATADYIDAGPGPGKVQFWSGARPANGAIPAGTLLAVVELAEPCGVVTPDVLTMVVPIEGMVLASGLVGWCRFLDGSDNHAIDGSVTVTGGGGDCEVGALAVYEGGSIRVTQALFG